MDRLAGSTDQSVSFAAFTTATGAAVTVTSATAGLSLWYRRGGTGAKVAVSPSDLATLATAHADGGILVIEGQDHRLDLPDAAFAAGVDVLEWGGSATGVTIDGGSCNLIGQATTGSVGAPLTSVQTQAAAAAAITAASLPTAPQIDTQLSGTHGAGSWATATSVAVSDKTGFKLASDGLDAIADPDDLTPGVVPTTFTQKLRWLIQRFWKADKTATAITVKNEAGQTITSQAITSSGDNETLGTPS